jgi:hypothetical protein
VVVLRGVEVVFWTAMGLLVAFYLPTYAFRVRKPWLETSWSIALAVSRNILGKPSSLQVVTNLHLTL